MQEALLYNKHSNHAVQCQACNHCCLILPSKRGICGVRENQRGKLYSLVYGKLIALNIDPIEKKPLFHFLPGSQSLSIATVGCNLHCLNCQNSDISQNTKNQSEIIGDYWPSEKIVQEAIKNQAPSISYTYTEPTVFLEYTLDVMKLARKHGLKNIWVTNGYMTTETLKLIRPYLDAVNVDLKFFKDDLYQQICGAHLQPILDSLKWFRKHKVWLEITTLVIPGYTDQDNQLANIASFIKNELGDNVPWHLSLFHPSYQMRDVSPTPTAILEQAHHIGKKIGLRYVYIGNVQNNNKEHTYCPKCDKINIERQGFIIRRLDKNGKCWNCRTKLDIIIK